MATQHKTTVLDRAALEIALVRQGTNDLAHMWRQIDTKMPLAKKLYTLLYYVWPNVGTPAKRRETRETRLRVLGYILRRQIASTSELTVGEVSALVSWMEDKGSKYVREGAREALLAVEEYSYVSKHV
jgi:hypothetical protein